MGRRPKHTFFQRRYTDCQQTHEKMLKSLIIIEMQIKTTMRYHLTLVRMAIIKTSTDEQQQQKNLQTINAGEGVEKREPSCTVGGTVN